MLYALTFSGGSPGSETPDGKFSCPFSSMTLNLFLPECAKNFRLKSGQSSKELGIEFNCGPRVEVLPVATMLEVMIFQGIQGK